MTPPPAACYCSFVVFSFVGSFLPPPCLYTNAWGSGVLKKKKGFFFLVNNILIKRKEKKIGKKKNFFIAQLPILKNNFLVGSLPLTLLIKKRSFPSSLSARHLFLFLFLPLLPSLPLPLRSFSGVPRRFILAGGCRIRIRSFRDRLFLIDLRTATA